MADSKTEAKTGAKTGAKTAGRSAGRIKVTLVRSFHGRLASHKACVSGLGLRRMHHTVEVEDTPCTRGMINKVSYMLRVEES